MQHTSARPRRDLRSIAPLAPFTALALLAASCYSSGGFVDGGSSRDVQAAWDASRGDDGPPPPPGDASGGDDAEAAPASAGPDALDASAPPDSGSPAVTVTPSDAGPAPDGAPAADGSPDPTGGAAQGYTLVFFDEFDGTSLDRSKWCTRYVYPGGPALQVPDSGCTGPEGTAGTLDYLNDEQERYVDYNTQGETMHAVAGGTLTLRATKTRADAAVPYEAAMIRSKFEFKPSESTSYYVTARLRLPDVIGTWPSMWLNGGYGTNGKTQWPPEIDIFEGALNGVEDTANMLRMGSQVKGAQTDSHKQEVTYSQSFNTTWDDYYAPSSLRDVWVKISAVWTATSVCYFVDAINTMCENYRWNDNGGAPANPASVLLNLAIGGSWAGRHGIDDAMFPTSLQADYVHVYAFDGQTAPSPPPD